MNTFLSDLALAHQHEEGYYPGSLAYRNNNPGNLRGKDGLFIKFPSYAAGFEALKGDLKVKIFGTAGSILRYMQGTGKMYDELVMFEYVAIYAPSADHNNPTQYCEKLCFLLARYNIKPNTPLTVLAQLIRGQIDRAADPQPAPIAPELRSQMAQNALRWASEPRASMLRRLIARLQKLI